MNTAAVRCLQLWAQSGALACNGTERPVGFASRTLNAAEKNYSQLDKEGAAVMFALKKFHKHLYGRSFEIITDHKPLVSLFGEFQRHHAYNGGLSNCVDMNTTFTTKLAKVTEMLIVSKASQKNTFC